MQDARYVSAQKPPIFSGLRLFKGQPKPPPPPPKDIPPSSSTLSLPLSDSSSYKEPATNVTPYRSPSPSSSTTSHPTHTLTTKKSLFKLPGLNRSKSYAPATAHDDNNQDQHETPDPNVSAPWNFQHDLHVDDGFVGLPPTWLSQAGLSAQDIEEIVSRRRQQAQYAKMAPPANAASTAPSSIASHAATPDTSIGLPPSYSTPLSDYGRSARGEAPPLSSRDAPKRKESLSRREKIPKAPSIQAPTPPRPSISPKPSFNIVNVPVPDEEEDQSPRTAVLPPRLTLSQDRTSGDWSESLFSALPSEVGGGFDSSSKGRSPSPPRLPPLADLGLGANTISGQASRVPAPTVTSAGPTIVRTGSPPIVSIRPLNLAPKAKTQAALLQSVKAKALAAKKVDEPNGAPSIPTAAITVTPAPSTKRAGPPKPLSLSSSSSETSEQRPSVAGSSSSPDLSPQPSPPGPSVPRSKLSPTGSHGAEAASPSNMTYHGLSPTDSYYYGAGSRSPAASPSPSASSFDDRSPSSAVFVQVGGRLDLPKVRPRHEPTESVSSTTLSYLMPQTPVAAHRTAQPTEEQPKPNGKVPLLSVSSHKGKDDKDDRLVAANQSKKPQASRKHLSEAVEDAAAGSFLDEWLLDDSNADYEPGETPDQDSVPFTASIIPQQYSRMRVPQTPMGDALPDSPFVTSPLPREQQEPTPPLPTPQAPIRKGAPGRHVPPKLNLLRPARVIPEAFKPLEDDILPDDPNGLFGDLDMVGEGDSGSVYSVRVWAEDPNATRTVAVKQVRVVDDVGTAKLQSLQHELQVMRNVRHLHILWMEGLYLSGETLWIKMELMERSLADLLELNPAGLQIEEWHLARFANDMLSAIAHLADKRIAHRDLRSDNVLISPQGLLKLADFSNAVQWTSANCTRTDPVGLIPWQAPEVRSGNYNVSKVDVWSVGATIWEVIESAPPFLDDVQEGREPGTRWPPLSQPGNYSSALQEFLRMSSEPSSSRPTPQKLLQSQFIKRSCTRGDILDLLSQARSIENDDQGVLEHYEDEED